MEGPGKWSAPGPVLALGGPESRPLRANVKLELHVRTSTVSTCTRGVSRSHVKYYVCEIFSVKEWHDLENQVMGRSRSLKMAPFDRPHATFYWSAIV